MSIHLVVDIGNSRTKVGLFKNRDLFKKAVFKNQELSNLDQFIPIKEIDKGIISSVNKTTEKLIPYKKINFPLLWLNAELSLPFKNNYVTANTLGSDRIALVAAAQKLYPQQNVLLIDAGSCITYDFLTAEGIYLGGAISPGVKMRLKAMNQFTNSLPLIDWDAKELPNILGDSTRNSILSGAVCGAVKEIEGFFSFYNQHYRGIKTIITGGDAIFFEKALKNTIFAIPNLVLKGLNELLIFNSE